LSLTLTGVADLHDVRGTARLHRPLPFHITRGQLALANDVIELIGVEGRVDGVPLTADGALSGPAFTTVAIEMRTEGADMARLARVIPGLSEVDAAWGGAVTGWAQLTGTLPDLTIVGHAAGPSITLDKLAISDLAGDLRFTGESLTVTNLTGRGFGGTFHGSAWATVGETPRFLFTGGVRDVDVGAVMVAFVPPPEQQDAFSPHEITGRVTGPLSVKLTGTDTLDIVTRPRGTVRLGRYTAGEVDAGLRIQATGAAARIQVDRLSAKTPLGVLDLRGSLDERNTLDFTVRASAVQLGPVAALAGQADVTGTGFATGTLTGTLANPSFTGDFHAVHGTVAATPFTDVTGSITAALGEHSAVTLSNLRVLAGGSRVDLDATISARGADAWALSGTATLPRTSLAALLETAGLSLPLDGFVEGEIEITHAPDDPRGSGRLLLSRPAFTLGDTVVEFDSAEIPFTLQGQTLTLTQAALSYQGNPIAISGTLSLDPATPEAEQLALRMTAPKVVLDSLVSPLTGTAPETLISFTDGGLCLPFDATGALALTATVRATLTPRAGETPEQALRRTLRVDSTVRTIDTVTIAGVPFTDGEIAASYDGGSETLTLTRFALARSGPGTGYAMALAADSTFQTREQDLDMRFALSRANVQIGADLAQLRADALTMLQHCRDLPGRADALTAISALPTPFGGTAALSLWLRGTLQRPTVRAALTLRDLRMAGNPLPDVDGTITYDTAPRLITFEELSLRGGADRTATASLTGSLTLPVKDGDGREISPGPMELSFNAQNINPGEIGGWLRLPALQAITGKATIDAAISATTAHPRVDAYLDIAELHYAAVPFKALSASITLDDDGIWVGRWVTPEDAPPANGEPPVRFAGRQIFPDGASTLQFAGTDGDTLEPLELFGYLPFRWNGPLSPEVPLDAPLLGYARLPRQGLDLIHAYAPDFP
ncbi:MAG TPA: hypothetical protein PLZ36_12575, partial [Armatimonadota bacterium]|nr:hypothetical protein [Armatimonadota bacterium]